MPTETLRTTPLHDRHAAAGARLVPFAGWEMPVQYEGVGHEHIAVRTGAGVFDVSHMGEIETSGPQAEAFLQSILSNDVTKIAERGAQYSVLCAEDGGVLDDLFTYRLSERRAGRRRPAEHRTSSSSDRFLTVTNASNHEADLAWFTEHAGAFEVTLTDAREGWAMLAVQGPGARAAVARLTGGELPERMRTADLDVAGVECLVCGTGYTGEDGVEIMAPPEGATDLWDSLIAEGVTPAGLGARDTLRLEACFHLYGNDLSVERNPLEAGLGWCCKLDTDFIGSRALRGAEPTDALVPFAFTGPGIPRQGNAVSTRAGDGVVTSGSMSPCLGHGIGMAYVPLDAAQPGTPIEVDVRGKSRAAEVREKPLYPPSGRSAARSSIERAPNEDIKSEER